MKLIVVVGSC